MKEAYEDLAVVCYINSTAEIKAHCDVCVTSANAVKIVKKLPNKNIFFVPDRNLGTYVAEQVPEKNMIVNDGYCPIHERMTVESLQQMKKKYPKAKVVIHPECTKELQSEADYIGSTTGIIRYVSNSESRKFIIGTETGVLYELKKQNPDKRFYTIRCNQICQDMKFITLEKIRDVLEKETNQIKIESELAGKALKPLMKMLELAK